MAAIILLATVPFSFAMFAGKNLSLAINATFNKLVASFQACGWKFTGKTQITTPVSTAVKS